MVSLIVTLLVGALIGWLASVLMKTDNQQGWVANILVGIIGSALGRWLFGDVLGLGGAFAAGTFTFTGVVWGVVGSVILILILKAIKVLR